jgi:hypothetical protein
MHVDPWATLHNSGPIFSLHNEHPFCIVVKQLTVHFFAGEIRQFIPSNLKIGKDKDKVVPVLFFLTKHHAIKAYLGSGGIAPRIL